MNYKVQDDILQVSIAGDLLSTCAQDLKHHFLNMMETPQVRTGRWKTLDVDLSTANMVDSMGLNLLVFFLKTVAERDARMRIRIADKNLNRLLRFTRLNEHAEILYA